MPFNSGGKLINLILIFRFFLAASARGATENNIHTKLNTRHIVS